MQQMMSYRELGTALNLSERTLRRMLASGDLPQPLRLGRSVRWPSELIDAWLQARAAEAAGAVGAAA
jgi:excisionase family DNA binding protein